MRLLGVDFGRKRIGISVGETEPRVTAVRSALEASGTLAKDADSLATLARQEGCAGIVVGVPYRADGRPGELATICIRLAELLHERGFEVHTVNEARTTAEAEKALSAGGHRRRSLKDRRDSEAARLILERFFDGLDRA